MMRVNDLALLPPAPLDVAGPADTVAPMTDYGIGGGSASGDHIGSRLWLLSREKQLAGVLERARHYAEEALTWLVEDGVATAVQVTATNPRQSLCPIPANIARPSPCLSEVWLGSLSISQLPGFFVRILTRFLQTLWA